MQIPVIRDAEIEFAFPDPERELASVSLLQEIRRPRNGPPFDYDPERGEWVLAWPRPDADRFEYMIEIAHPDGGREAVVDPTNPRRAPGPFGDKSVVELPGYRPPEWLDVEVERAGTVEEHAITSRTLRAELPLLLWSAPGVDADEPLPLLIVHDGPEYARYSGLDRLLDVAHAQGRIPAMRAALIAPVERDQILSASAAYGRAFAHEILPFISHLAPTPHGRSMRIGMGASLGALAMLHIHRAQPAAFGALFLQSGSYFRQRFDKQESGFVRFRRISRFMGRVLNADDWPHPIPVTITCGTLEENLANNRATAAALRRQGYDVRMVENRDGHTWVGWRDVLDPHLVDLLQRIWG